MQSSVRHGLVCVLLLVLVSTTVQLAGEGDEEPSAQSSGCFPFPVQLKLGEVASVASLGCHGLSPSWITR